MVYGGEIVVQTKGFSEVKNISDQVQRVIQDSKIKKGLVNVSVIGSTASVSTIEYEPALVEDLREQLEKQLPHTMSSRHSRTWGDDNGFSHLRATLMGPSLTVPVVEGAARLGTWQQIVVIDHDNRSRSRKVYIQVMGD